VTARFTNFIGLMRVSLRSRPRRPLFLPDGAFPGAKLNPDIAGTLQGFVDAGGPAFIADRLPGVGTLHARAGRFFPGGNLERQTASWGATR
jgi:hypothetical protein